MLLPFDGITSFEYSDLMVWGSVLMTFLPYLDNLQKIENTMASSLIADNYGELRLKWKLIPLNQTNQITGSSGKFWLTA